MLDKALSPFCIPVARQLYNILVCKIWSKYTISFKSYEYFY